MGQIAKFRGIEVWAGQTAEYFLDREFFEDKLFIAQDTGNGQFNYVRFNGEIVGVWDSANMGLVIINKEKVKLKKKESKKIVESQSDIDILISELLDKAEKEFQKYGKMV